MSAARGVRGAIVLVGALMLVALPGAAGAEMWVLAYPPLTAGSTTPNVSAPLPEWTLWQLFPSQSGCEEHRTLWQMVIKAEDEEKVRAAGRRAVFAQGIPSPSANMDALEAAGRRWVVETGTKLRGDKGAMNQVLVAQCVSAADPRLAPRPAR